MSDLALIPEGQSDTPGIAGATIPNTGAAVPGTAGPTVTPVDPGAASDPGGVELIVSAIPAQVDGVVPNALSFWPSILDDNAVMDMPGNNLEGWTTASNGTWTAGEEFATLAPIDGPVYGTGVTKVGSLPTSGDYILYFKVRADVDAGSGVNFQLGLSHARVVMSLGYNWEIAAYESQRVSFACRHSGALSSKVAGPLLDYSTEVVECALQYDSRLGVMSYWLREGGSWKYYGGGLCDDPYDNSIKIYTGGDDAANGYLYYALMARPNIVSIGDSICAGHNLFDPDPSHYAGTDDSASSWQSYSNSWPKLRNDLVINYGIGSQSSAQIDARVADMLAATSPRLVFLHCSTNDSGAGISAVDRTANIQASVDKISAAGAKVVLLNSLYPNGNSAGNPDNAVYYKTWWDDYVDSISKVDFKIDISVPVTGANGYLDAALAENDGVHPNLAGYAVIGDYINGKPQYSPLVKSPGAVI